MTNQATVVADLLSHAMERGYLLLDEAELPADFFKLNTGLAGDLLQKFVNYQLPLAIVVQDATLYGDRFNELVREHRGHSRVRFFADQESAASWLSAQR
ncbi:DUF4180 domain-containing protein [Saccharospirillum sp. HFRX-1]|uniref:DUF4180 domain-containing protein n=1 Tax=unclassified Saccharospirillum TaxID=2633430 RepID=UPI003717CDA1